MMLLSWFLFFSSFFNFFLLLMCCNKFVKLWMVFVLFKGGVMIKDGVLYLDMLIISGS